MIYLATFIYAIVGGPGTGKTSIVEELKKQEEVTVREVATDYIQEKQANGIEAPWFESDFQLQILQKHLERESDAKELGKERIFTDRSMLDGYIYRTLHGKTETEEFAEIDRIIKQYDLSQYYKAIFYVNPYNEGDFACETNEVRHEDTDEALQLAKLTYEMHKKHCPVVIEVPGNRTPAERAQFVLECVNHIEKKSTIPVVDMRDFYNDEKRGAFIETVKNALHDYGFFAVTHTGIKQEVIDNAFSRAAEFFGLDHETKMHYEGSKTNFQRGYTFIGKETGKGAKVGDFKEFLHFGREQDAFLNNVWPEEIALKGDMLKYLNHLEDYMVATQHVLALALGEEETFFDDKTAEGDCLLRVIHYPKNKQSSDKRAVWASEHTDIDLFTILPRATEEGLELQLPNGEWMPVNVTEDAFIINGGDFLEIFSNGYFRSARHRVMAPRNNEDVERYSMVFFVHPTSETELYPLAQWTEDGEKYAKATRIEMLMERLVDIHLASEDMIKALADSGVMDRLVDVKRASPDAMRALKERGLASEKVLNYLNSLE